MTRRAQIGATVRCAAPDRSVRHSLGSELPDGAFELTAVDDPRDQESLTRAFVPSDGPEENSPVPNPKSQPWTSTFERADIKTDFMSSKGLDPPPDTRVVG